ncbi:MAG: alpha/beta hydrolase [bacterium]
MSKWIPIALLVLVWVPPICAQDGSLNSDPEWYRYGELPAQQVVVFKPAANHSSLSQSAIVVFHGGGWSMGSVEWAFGAARRFAEMGMVGIAVSYRLSDQRTITPVDAMADARMAIRWVRKNAEQLGISPNRIAAYGWSAGAHLAASAAIFPDLPPQQKTSCVPNALLLKSPGVDVIGDHWFMKLLGDSLNPGEYSPVEHVHSELPPTLILQGRTDTVTPLSGAQRFCDEMIEAGNRCDLVIYEGVGHLFTPAGEPDNGSPNSDPEVEKDSWRKMDGFLRSLGYID